MSAVVSGLDGHKEYTYATIMDQEGGIVARDGMPNEEIPAFLKPHGVERVAMEATIGIAPIYWKLVEQGYDVLVSHATNTSKGNSSISPDRYSIGSSRVLAFLSLVTTLLL